MKHLTVQEQKEAARLFYQRWANKGQEDKDDRSFWLDLIEHVLGVEYPTEHFDFQKRVTIDGTKKKIDAYIPETKVLIEQKSLGVKLDKKLYQSGNIYLTPYEQAKRYSNYLTHDENPRYIVVSNFAEIWIYDMNQPDPQPEKVYLDNLQNEVYRLKFLIKEQEVSIKKQETLSMEAGDIVGEIYDALHQQYQNPDSEESLRSLNALCVRLVFCMYAEDAGIFGEYDQFYNYMKDVPATKWNRELKTLFSILNTPEEERSGYDPELEAFPFVNGGLFNDDNMEIPSFNEEIVQLILEKGSKDFNWSEINPTIFGAVFESTLNPEKRKENGMHFTPIENIHKVIDPLFLDDLKEEFEDCKNTTNAGGARKKKLLAFQNKLASLTFMDPACGSGNFLTETYLSLRRLENQVVAERMQKTEGQLYLDLKTEDYGAKISIRQFYGIEINDFAVAVAKTAMWIAEAQMLAEMQGSNDVSKEFLPLTTNTNIVRGNALTVDWETIVPSAELNYIMGNPPFYGARKMTKEQTKELFDLFDGQKGVGDLDYVAGWYIKAANYIKDSNIKVALVSTNSISQGEQPAILWKPLFEKGVHIDYAYRTFRWDSEAHIKAHVHCIIIGFSINGTSVKRIYEGEAIREARNISPYIIDAPSILVASRTEPIYDVPEISLGSMANDGGELVLSVEEKDRIGNMYPELKPFIKSFIGSREYIQRKERYCFWLREASPEILEHKEIKPRLVKIQKSRGESKRAGTRKLADTPYLFGEDRQPNSNYLMIPRVSSQNRAYIPIGFLTPETIASDASLIIPNADLYMFGVLTSNVHMAWVETVSGRLKSDYRYSGEIVYNNFPWPEATQDQKSKIEEAANNILLVRDQFSNSKMSTLYDKTTMPRELRKAHDELNRAVMNAYGFPPGTTSKEDCVLALLQLYWDRIQEIES